MIETDHIIRRQAMSTLVITINEQLSSHPSRFGFVGRHGRQKYDLAYELREGEATGWSNCASQE
jgi:hypothetical protein